MSYKILIFGGSGYLGKSLIVKLLEDGHKIYNFDLIISSEFNHKNYNFIKGDIKNLNDLKKSIKGKDIVFHYAGLSDLDEAVDKPEDSLELNVLSTIRIMKISKINNVKQFLFASSIYASSDSGGFYKSSKLSAETYIKEFSKKYNLDYTIIRFGSVYGPGADYRNGIFKIIKKAISTKKISYNGHKDAVREYIHVYDAAKSAVLCIDNNNYKNKIVIATGPNRVSLKDLLHTLRELLKIKSKIQFKESNHQGHYIRTPYVYKEIPIRIIIDNYIDLNEGIVQVINEINENN